MVNLYLDENVNVFLATLLRARNIKVLTTLESNMLGDSEAEQLEYATTLNAAIVTHNRVDFENLYKKYIELNKTLSGIIVLIRRDVYHKAKNLSRFVVIHKNVSNQLWYV